MVVLHHQTVVPLLANTKKASLQAVHTSFVNTSIDNMTDNRVLNYRPPPNNGEKSVEPATSNSVTAPLRPLQTLVEVIQKETEREAD